MNKPEHYFVICGGCNRELEMPPYAHESQAYADAEAFRAGWRLKFVVDEQPHPRYRAFCPDCLDAHHD